MRSFNDWYFDLFESGNGARLNQQEIAEEAWDYQQSKIDELNCDINVQKEQLNKLDRVIDGYAIEVDKLQKQRDSFIKAYEIEIDENVELQKRVDAVKTLIDEYRDPPTEDKTFRHALSIVAYELEQALKGGSDE